MSDGYSDAIEHYKQVIDDYLKAIVDIWEAKASGLRPATTIYMASKEYAKIPRVFLDNEFKLPKVIAMPCKINAGGSPLEAGPFDNPDRYFMWLFSLMIYTNHSSYLIRLFRACPYYRDKVLIFTDEKWQITRAVHESPFFQDGHADYLLGLCKLRWSKDLMPGQPLMLVGHFKLKKIRLDKVVQLTPKKIG